MQNADIPVPRARDNRGNCGSPRGFHPGQSSSAFRGAERHDGVGFLPGHSSAPFGGAHHHDSGLPPSTVVMPESVCGYSGTYVGSARLCTDTSLWARLRRCGARVLCRTSSAQSWLRKWIRVLRPLFLTLFVLGVQTLFLRPFASVSYVFEAVLPEEYKNLDLLGDDSQFWSLIQHFAWFDSGNTCMSVYDIITTCASHPVAWSPEEYEKLELMGGWLQENVLLYTILGSTAGARSYDAFGEFHAFLHVKMDTGSGSRLFGACVSPEKCRGIVRSGR